MESSSSRHWLVKTEPRAYSWDDLVEDGWTYWDGIRNYEARNNLRKMSEGDLLLYYHSGRARVVVGIARVTRGHYQDPTTDDARWSAVDLEPVEALSRPVALAEIKKDPRLSEMALVRRGRLSVAPVTEEEFTIIRGMADQG